MKATLISIGNEILSGAIIDSNSHFIAKELFKIGITINKKITIADDKKSILKSLQTSFKESNFVFTTGGLGPTKDDITKNVICNFFKDKLVINKSARDHIYKLFKKLNRQVNKINEDQALVPSTSKVIINKFGTAPCLWIKKNSKILISLPGVPYEVEELIKNEIIPLIKKKFKLPYIILKEILSVGIPESILSEKLSEWEKKLPKNIQLAYLPSPSYVKIQLTEIGENKEEIESNLKNELNKLYNLLGSSILLTTYKNSEDQLIKFLQSNKKTVAVVDSCTGGLLSYTFFSKNNYSKYYLGGINGSLTTIIKKNILKIPNNLLIKNFFIDEEYAKFIAKKIAFLMNSDLGISIIEISDIDKNNNQNIFEKACIGIFYNGKEYSKKIYLPNLNHIEFMNQINKQALEFAFKVCDTI